MTDEKRQRVIRALLQERDAAQAKGRVSLVEQINDQLRRYGGDGSPAARRATRRAGA